MQAGGLGGRAGRAAAKCPEPGWGGGRPSGGRRSKNQGGTGGLHQVRAGCLGKKHVQRQTKGQVGGDRLSGGRGRAAWNGRQPTHRPSKGKQRRWGCGVGGGCKVGGE